MSIGDCREGVDGWVLLSCKTLKKKKSLPESMRRQMFGKLGVLKGKGGRVGGFKLLAKTPSPAMSALCGIAALGQNCNS